MDRYIATSTTSTIGLMPTRLLLTPATASWTLPFGAYLLFLSGRVAALRFKTRTALGDHSKPRPHTLGKTEFGGGMGKTELGKMEFGNGMEDADNPDPLFLENRCLRSYLETAPMAMIIALVAELNGANRRALNYALGALLLAKVTHIELGLRCAGTVGMGRPVGYYAGQSWMAGMAGYCAYLVRDYWWV